MNPRFELTDFQDGQLLDIRFVNGEMSATQTQLNSDGHPVSTQMLELTEADQNLVWDVLQEKLAGALGPEGRVPLPPLPHTLRAGTLGHEPIAIENPDPKTFFEVPTNLMERFNSDSL